MYNREHNGDKEHRARFRFGRPDSNVYPYGRDTPDDVFPYYDYDETDEVHEKDDTESGPLMVRVLIGPARFPSVPKFNADMKESMSDSQRRKSRYLQERIWEHDLEWENQEEPQGGVDERNVQWPFLDLGEMVNQKDDVAVYQDQQ